VPPSGSAAPERVTWMVILTKTLLLE
jgi:hypothetical protein